MSNLESEPGQKVLLPTERHDFDDNNAESVTVSSDRKRQFDIRDRRRIYLQQFIFRMIKEIGLMFLFAVTYAALTNDPPKISKSPPAYPFFPKGSAVKDWYKGEISAAIESARQYDIAFVMFYAPWDAESQDVRWQFELTARHMQKLVTFVAVNCWQPESECRNQYSKVYNWPVLIAYPTHGRGIQYNGPKTVLYMMRFLHSVMAPLKRVQDLGVHYLQQHHDAVVVANINFLPKSVDYSIIYSTALRLLEKDPFQEIAFAVNTKVKGIRRELYVYTWNNTLMYLDDDWKPEALLNWIYKSIQQVTMWVTPIGTKSQLLSNYIQPGPALILFTPRNPLFTNTDYYDLLHEVGLEYHYCKNKTNSFGAYLLSLTIHENRIATYRNSKLPCISQSNKKATGKKTHPSVVTYVKSKLWLNNTFCAPANQKSDVCGNYDIIHEIERNFHVDRKPHKAYDEVVQKQTQREEVVIEDEFIMDSYKNIFKTSMLTVHNDPKAPHNLLKIWKQNRCKMQHIAEKYSPPLYSDSTVNAESDEKYSILGLACKTNRSLTLLALDSLTYHHFAEAFGVDLFKRKDKTAAIILNEKMETHHVLETSVTDKSLREFIYKFTENNLSRALYSNSKKRIYTHSYTDNKKDCSRNDQFSIVELYSETFLPTVMQSNKAVIVLYHSKQCSFCHGISYMFLRTARAFSFASNIVFARIDGDLNSLPWEYTMETYPTIIFFPTKTKSETRVFPQNVHVTVPSLISFILSNLNPSLKLHAMWSLCNATNFESDKLLCISSVRAECLSLINGTLKEWRMADVHKKPKILGKLQQLRNLHLILAHSPQDTVAIQKYMKWLQLNHFQDESNRDCETKCVRNDL